MPTIKRRYVWQARKRYTCNSCFCVIDIGQSYVYLYGMAHYGEKPYPLHICEECDYESIKHHENIQVKNG
jgi:hypothetical protein